MYICRSSDIPVSLEVTARQPYEGPLVFDGDISMKLPSFCDFGDDESSTEWLGPNLGHMVGEPLSANLYWVIVGSNRENDANHGSADVESHSKYAVKGIR
jgi:hypothetical protein